MATKQVVKAKSQAVATVPDYIKKGSGRGNEEVGLSDVVIPRIEIVQGLSPCLKKSDPAFIARSEVGDLFNSVTRQLYGASVNLIPVLFKKEYLVWKDRKKGGGFRGAYATIVEASARIDEEQKPEDFQAMETAQHICLLVNDDGDCEEAVLSMSRTKLKVSRQWNSLVRINKGDRFSRVYSVFAVDDSTDQGEFKNFGVQTAGFPTKAQYLRAEALYEAIKSGARKVAVDTSQEGADPDSSSSTTDY